MALLAEKTLAAIDESIRLDGGAAYRTWLGRVLPHIGDAYRGAEPRFRGHMGASGLGKECSRAIWYSFRWFTAPAFAGRMLRLFNRGHMEEGRFIAMLLSIGVQVYQQDADGKQFRISDAGGHLSGSGDGVCVGIPDLPPGQPALLEFKTHSSASFKKLEPLSVRVAKPEHYVQVQTYMRKMQLDVCLYMAVNKDNDELYGELIYIDPELADRYIDRGKQIVWLQAPPAKIARSAGDFRCRFCDHKAVCHMGAPADTNCRSCESSVPQPDGTWACANEANPVPVPLSKEQQLSGCAAWKQNRRQ